MGNERAQNEFKKLNDLIKDLVPEAKQEIKYGIPTFVYKGKNLIHIAIYDNHIGIYPGSEPIEVFGNELKDFKTSKGTIRVSNDQTIPFKLVEKIVRYNKAKIDQKE